ncbi:MAG: DUF2064 domain-containing protein [Sedimentitalea sp.]
MRQRTLVVMLKEPRPGRVKTRLGRDIGMVPAAWWFRHQAASLVRRLRDPRWQIVLAVAPDHAGLRSRIWPGDLVRVPQGQGDLGRRMLGAMARFRGDVCLIGADIPGVTRVEIARAFGALGGRDVVFGPASDGGFWLIGQAAHLRLARHRLGGVRWSSKHALADSCAALPGRRIAHVDVLGDVDTARDLLAMTRPDRRGRAGHEPHPE